MAFTIQSRDLVHREEIRIPMPHLGEGQEFFKFTGMVHFNGEDALDAERPGGPVPLTGAGKMVVAADYRHLIPEGKAILPSQWTDLVGIANFKTTENTGSGIWAIRDYAITNHRNFHDDDTANVFLPNGHLSINCHVFLGDNDFIVMMTYDVTIVGTIVNYQRDALI